MTDLLPCPFCGGDAVAITGPVQTLWGVTCLRCACWFDDRAPTDAAAITAWNTRTPTPDPNAGAVKVKRGGKWIVVDGKAYDLRDCTEVAAELTRKSGSNNIAFDMFPWFFTGSPYADQIIDLGVTPQAVPDDFIAEYIPDLGKVWRSRQTIWETYIRTAETTPDPRDAVIARLVEAMLELRLVVENINGEDYLDRELKRLSLIRIDDILAAAKEVMG